MYKKNLLYNKSKLSNIILSLILKGWEKKHWFCEVDL